jgi:uncharacterized membrane protein (UPF0127 family)
MSVAQLPRIVLYRYGRALDVDIALAATFWSRLRGLACTSRFPCFGLLIVPCGSIHMLGMRYPIEAVFVSSAFHVLKIARNVRPWVGMAFCAQAHAVLEWQLDSAEKFGIGVGDTLKWELAK